MFTESSAYYDLVYSFKDYKKESDEIAEMLRAECPDCKTILDVGCGTAEHHLHLKDHFSPDGIDLNETFISIASEKNPEGFYSVADMRNFDLGKKYDVILCLFSSIGYLESTDEIVAALRSLGRHLNENGLVIVEPWFTPETYGKPRIGMVTNETPELKICRMSRSELHGEFTILHFDYMVNTLEDGVRYFSEQHKVRLTSVAEMKHAFHEAGFEVRFEEKGLGERGLYFGVKK